MKLNILIFFSFWSPIFVRSQLFATEINDNTFLSKNVTVVHNCYFSHLLCTQMSIKFSRASLVKYEKENCIDCNSLLRQNGASDELFKTTIPLIIRDEYICIPDYWNQDPIFIYSSNLSIFLIQNKYSTIPNKQKLMRQHISYEVNVPPPYSRKRCLHMTNKCPSIFHELSHLSFSHKQYLRSPFVQTPFPLASSAFVSLGFMGQYLFFPTTSNNKYFNKYFLTNSKRFTISMWLYLHKNCPSSFCNLLSFYNGSTDSFYSPVILLKHDGFIHIQSRLLHSNAFSAFLTGFKVPLWSWVQMVLTINCHQWSISLFSETGKDLGRSGLVQFTGKTDIDLQKGVGIVGGSQFYYGFEGFVSDIYLYPGMELDHQIVRSSRRGHAGKDLQITNEQQMKICAPVMEELNFYLHILKDSTAYEKEKDTCPRFDIRSSTDEGSRCRLRSRDLKRPRLFMHLKKLIKNDVKISKLLQTYETFDIQDQAEMTGLIGNYLFERSVAQIKRAGLGMGRLVPKYLQDSSCLGNPEATYALAAMYFYGIDELPINTTRALELLLTNVLRFTHRLSLLALGNLHKFALVPGMKDLSAVFYKGVADLTAKDINNLENGDMFNDNIRLTNEEDIKQHTDENDDLFYWMQHQAEAGIPWAKERLGRRFYWGSQGIQRNMNQAVNYLRMAAEAPDALPQNHFDYGSVLVKNSNSQKEVEEGKLQLLKASEKDPRALTTLGWLAESRERNLTLAYEYYLKAHNLGNPEATYNLGIYHHFGRIPGHPVDKVAAYHLFEKAAVRNQLNAGAMYSHYQMTGVTGVVNRNLSMGISWARHVGEQNPRVGFNLGEGVRAYRKKKIELSIFYYLLAAFTGIELGNFNAAVLCEEYEAVVRRHVERECVWYHYNLSLQREEHQIQAYSLIKMGDKMWYGCGNIKRNVVEAASFYIRAAFKYEPQAFFNLAFIMENSEIDIIPMLVGRLIHYPTESEQKSPNEWRYNVILKLYGRCEDLSTENTYIPCKLASQRLRLAHFWAGTKIKIQMMIAVVLTAFILHKFVRLWAYHNEDDLQNSV